MAVTTVGDIKPRQELIRAGIVEATMQFIDVFNAGSNGAIQMIDQNLEGDFNRENFWQLPSDLIARRDPTADGTTTAVKVTEDDQVGVKLNRRIGPVDMLIDVFKKNNTVAANQQDTASLIFGQEIGRRVVQEKLNTGLLGLRGALAGSASVLHDATGGALDTEDIIDGVAKFGDAGGEIVAWVMHSIPFYQLVKHQGVTKSVDGLSSVVLAGGSPATMGKPVIVTDSSSLVVTSGSGSAATTTYYSYGLVRNGLRILTSEPMTVINNWVEGRDNIKLVWQGEYAYNVLPKGYAFSTATPNPNDAALANTSNWTFKMDSYKNGAGVVITSRA